LVAVLVPVNDVVCVLGKVPVMVAVADPLRVPVIVLVAVPVPVMNEIPFVPVSVPPPPTTVHSTG
jgi:hypothetical protein